MPHTLGEIVARFGGELKGDPQRPINGLATLERAGSEQLSFLANPRYRRQLAATRAAAVILAPELAAECPVDAIVTAQPYLYFARVSQWLAQIPRPRPGIHPSAVVECAVPPSAAIGPLTWIGPDVILGDNCVIGAHCRIGPGVMIGADSWLYPGVTVYHGCRIGRRALIHSGAVIGADGFGFAQDGAHWVKIAQTGGVVIGDDVEIGANTTIDRGALDDTVIEDGVKLDNQIQIAHNVRIGRDTAIAGCVGIAGSTKIGARCTIGGAAMIIGHLTLVDDVHVSAGAFVGKSLLAPGHYSGSAPVQPHAEWLKNFAHLRHLAALADKIHALEKRLASLENAR